MGIRLRLILISVFSIGLSLSMSIFLYLKFEERNEYQELARRNEALLESLSAPISIMIAQGRMPEIDSLMHALHTRQSILELKNLYVLDHQGIVQASLSGEHYGQKLKSDFSAQAVSSPRRKLLIDGEKIRKISVPLHSGLRWGTLIAHFDLQSLEQRLEQSKDSIQMITLFILLLGLLGLWLGLSLFVVFPLHKLVAQAKRWAKGELSIRLNTDMGGEIGKLAEIMNQAMDTSENHQEHLQQAVKRQTAKLEKALSKLKEANTQLETQAMTDGLTGLYNHRFFRQSLLKEQERQERHQQPFALLMCDVDHFKNYNDLHGHPAGDTVLKKVASLLQEHTRNSDIVARYGGEEFTIMMLRTTEEEAMHRAQDLIEIIAAHPFPYKEQQPNGMVSISVGLAIWPEHTQDTNALLEKADQALYYSKKNGRNQLSSYSQILQTTLLKGNK